MFERKRDESRRRHARAPYRDKYSVKAKDWRGIEWSEPTANLRKNRLMEVTINEDGDIVTRPYLPLRGNRTLNCRQSAKRERHRQA